MEYDAEKLLFCIEKRPVIYNFHLRDYSNRSVLERQWEEVAAEMDMTVGDCKAKWVNLRNSYNRILREGSKTKRRKWYLTDAMEFLKDFVGVHRKISSSNGDETQLHLMKEQTQETEESNSSLTDAKDIDFQDSSSLTLFLNSHNVQIKQEVNTDSDEVSEPVATYLKSKIEAACQTAADKIAEPMVAFLESITEVAGQTAADDKVAEPMIAFLESATEAAGRTVAHKVAEPMSAFLKSRTDAARRTRADKRSAFLKVGSDAACQTVSDKETESMGVFLERNEAAGRTSTDKVEEPMVALLESRDEVVDETVARKMEEPIIEFFKSRTKIADQDENATLTFFKSLIPDVEKLPEAKKRKFKLDVMTLLNQSLDLED